MQTLPHYNDLSQYIREFCNELSLSGIKNYIHYFDVVQIEILEDCITYKKGFYNILIDFSSNKIHLYKGL